MITGGAVNEIDLSANSKLELFGTSFLLNDVPIAGLTAPGDSLLLPNRNGERLKATLLDGSILLIDLYPTNATGRDTIDPLAQLRLTMAQPVPEPTTNAIVIVFGLTALFSRRWLRA